MELHERFQALVDQHYGALWSYVSFLTGGATDAEDIVHQAFLLAFDHLAADETSIRDPGPWLRGTARNLVRAWWRQRRKAPQHVTDQLLLLADESDDALTTVTQAETRAALRNCLDKLRPEDRILLAKRYEDGFRVTSIARELRLNVATLRVRLFRIRRALKLCLEGQLSGRSAL